MKKQAYKLILAGVALLIVSGCTGMKPLFEVGTVPGLKSPETKGYTVRYGFHPSTGVFNNGNTDLITVQKDQKWKVSASFPAKMKFEFK